MTSWLSEDEQRHWRSWIAAAQLLLDQLDRDLQSEHGLTLADYEILVRLSDTPDRRLRMSELADVTLSSRSRLSHQIDRMQKADLIERQPCPDDRRGYFAVMTEHGWSTLVAAAPDHVASVRRNLVDVLKASEFAALGAASAKIADRLTGTSQD
ncbi:MAG: MarR family transcriptional regulator [Actinomycetes bacterium]|jgi:DNA-binding MarR family transcriptional regulator